MGWTSFPFLGSYNELVYHEFNRNGFEIQDMEILPSLQKGRKIAYVAIKHPKDYVFGLVILLERDDNPNVQKSIIRKSVSLWVQVRIIVLFLY